MQQRHYGLDEFYSQYHETAGLVLMAATSRLHGLDDARLREGRFDLKLRIDLPDQAERLQILEARLHKKPCSRFDLREFARLTAGASPAKLAALIDQAGKLRISRKPQNRVRRLVSSTERSWR
jgi:ATP-dependent Zn protease